MFLLLLGSVQEDALTSDEPMHITAGYASLRFRDARLNPEHPPLLKMLAAVPLLALRLHFPLTSPAWQEGLNDQWTTSELFLYSSGNDPHRIAALARLGPIVLTVVLGLVLFAWTRRWARSTAALLSLGLYVWSPTVLAHGRLVTTDVAAAFGVALAGFAFIPFLTTPGGRAALRAGLTLGLALLCKFSTVLLVPWVAALTLVWIVPEPTRRARYLRGLAILAGSAALLVLLPYLWATADYPPDRQLRDTYFTFFRVGGGPAGCAGDASAEADFARLLRDRSCDLRACVSRPPEGGLPRLTRCPMELAIWLADKPVVRAWGQYLAGLLWTMHRVHTGGTADFPFYFLGEVSASGSRACFPVVYAIKEALPWHLLSAWALLLALVRVWSSAWGVRPLLGWLRGHPAETCMLGWLVLYWGVAIQSNLNIGVRHLLPIFPFAMVLVARELSRWLARSPRPLRPAGRGP
jgi:4-amino-4-deoxy-L-arabinose transferase-like glycosyltransferase